MKNIFNLFWPQFIFSAALASFSYESFCSFVPLTFIHLSIFPNFNFDHFLYIYWCVFITFSVPKLWNRIMSNLNRRKWVGKLGSWILKWHFWITKWDLGPISNWYTKVDKFETFILQTKLSKRDDLCPKPYSISNKRNWKYHIPPLLLIYSRKQYNSEFNKFVKIFISGEWIFNFWPIFCHSSNFMRKANK